MACERSLSVACKLPLRSSSVACSSAKTARQGRADLVDPAGEDAADLSDPAGKRRIEILSCLIEQSAQRIGAASSAAPQADPIS